MEKYLSGSLTEAEFAQLESGLRGDPELRRLFLESCSLEMELVSLLQGEEAPPLRILPRRKVVTLALAAAFCALLVGLWVAWKLHREGSPDDLQLAAATPTPLPASAPPQAPQIVEQTPVEVPPVRLVAKLNKGEGKARITEPDGTIRDLPETAETFELLPDELLALSSDVQADLELLDGTQIHLHRGTQLRLDGDLAAPIVFLQGGGVDVVMAEAGDEAQPPKFLTSFMDVQAGNTEFRLLAVNDSSWVALRKGEARITRLADGGQVVLAKGNYAATHPNWPFQVMWAEYCPMWKHVSTRIGGDEYP
jgi:hypothetical protein